MNKESVVKVLLESKKVKEEIVNAVSERNGSAFQLALKSNRYGIARALIASKKLSIASMHVLQVN